MFLAKQNLALRGESNQLFTHNNGNFLQLVETVSKFDPVMFEHIRRIQAAKDQNKYFTSYLGDKIQNEILNLLGSEIKISF